MATLCVAKTLYTTYTSINIRMKSFWYIHSMEDHRVVKIKETAEHIDMIKCQRNNFKQKHF